MPPWSFRTRTRDERLAVGNALVEGRDTPDDADGFGLACTSLARPRAHERAENRPLVSILVCTFNRAGWLAEALNSALAQTWPVEVVVVDDGSSDETSSVLRGFEGRVRVFVHPVNAGKPTALNTGIAALRGEAYLVLDDDDKLLPGAIAVLAERLFSDESSVAVHGDTLVFDDGSGAVVDWKPASRLPPALCRQAVLATIPAMPGATLIRTAAQRRLAPYDPSLIRGQDMDHFLRLSELGPTACVPLPIQLYRRHDGLRGSAGARWKKHRDPAEHRRRFLASVQPVFRDRWRASTHPRAEGFAWAVGLHERDLRAEAAVELARWPAPWTPFERWIRTHTGHPAPPPGAPDSTPTLVIDDGDDGALAALLASLPPIDNLTVVAERPHDGLASCQLLWPGVYRVERPLTPRTGPIQVRLSSAPDWAPPLLDAALLLRLPPADAAIALAVALGHPAPLRTRLPPGAVRHPLALACVAAEENGPGALAEAANVLEAAPNWPPARLLAARACSRAGHHAEAAALAPGLAWPNAGTEAPR